MDHPTLSVVVPVDKKSNKGTLSKFVTHSNIILHFQVSVLIN